MANEKKKRIEGIILVVIGSIITVFFGVYGYLFGVQSTVYGYGFILPIIVGVVILVIGVCLVATSFSGTTEGSSKRGKPSKPSRWKQAEPIT